PNQFVNTRLLVDTLQNQILIPSSAIQHNGDTAFVYLIKPGPGNPKAAQGGSSSQTGASPSGGGNSAGGSRKGGGGQGSGAGQQGNGSGSGGGTGGKAAYHVEMQVVKTGATDNGWTAVTGIPTGTMVANSSFDKLQDQSDITLSKVGIPDTQTTISGESSAP
ncbi:MAG: hypothetical protein WBX06_16905, partial [Acidobacteriaceae bacterium]